MVGGIQLFFSRMIFSINFLNTPTSEDSVYLDVFLIVVGSAKAVMIRTLFYLYFTDFSVMFCPSRLYHIANTGP